MPSHYTQIQFIAANYSRLQGLREVPVGILVAAVSVWAMYNHGPTADLTVPILLTVGAALLYWLIDRFYSNTFGRTQQTAKMRLWEISASILFGLLALLAFWLDTAELPFSALGLVFAAALFEDYWRAVHSIKERSFRLYPENAIAASLILVVSLLPLTGLAWWERLGLQSQVLSMLTVVGIVITFAGIWGHLRIVRILPAGESKSDDNTL